jgi:hypothetical protein
VGSDGLLATGGGQSLRQQLAKGAKKVKKAYLKGCITGVAVMAVIRIFRMHMTDYLRSGQA